MRKFLTILSVGLVISSFFFGFQTGEAASLYAVSNNTGLRVGDSFVVTVYVNSEGIAINNTESVIGFPTDMLSVQSLSTAGSIFTLWVENPSFSNVDGKVSFVGGIPTPGYTGNNGKIVSITFKAKKSGAAQIYFNSGTVRANDGFGTDVTSNKSPLTITIAGVNQPGNLAELPGAPTIRSLDSFLPDSWQNVTSASFAWNVPSGVVSTGLALSLSTEPTRFVDYTPAISKKTITDLGEGSWYLNARFRNENGWGKVGSFKLNIDLTPPEIPEVSSTITDNDLIALSLKLSDKLSGIAEYAISVDDKRVIDEKNVSTDANETVTLSPQSPGARNIVVTAFDKAGNSSEKAIVVQAPQIKIPKIIDVPKKIQKGERIKLVGISPYPDSDIVVFLEQEGHATVQFIVKVGEDKEFSSLSSDVSGTVETGQGKQFSFTSDTIENEGLVSIWLKTSRGPDLLSDASPKVPVSVGKAAAFEFGSTLVAWLSVIVPVIGLILVLIFGTYYFIMKVGRIKKKIRRDLAKTETEIHEMFINLQRDLRKQIRLLERAGGKRELTEEEKKIIDKFTEHVESADKYFVGRLRDIEKNDL